MERTDLASLVVARNEEHLCAGVVEDVGHALGGFVEIDGNDGGAESGDGEIGDVPFGRVGSEEANAVAGLNAHAGEGGGETRDAAEEFLRGDGLPAGIGAIEQAAVGGMGVERFEETLREWEIIGHGMNVARATASRKPLRLEHEIIKQI